jgi:hypothetical protein
MNSDSQRLLLCPCQKEHGPDVGDFKANAVSLDGALQIRVIRATEPASSVSSLVIVDGDRYARKFRIQHNLQHEDGPVATLDAEITESSASDESTCLEVAWKSSGAISGQVEEALVLRSLQFARRRGASKVALKPPTSPVDEPTEINVLAIKAFATFSGLAPFRDWMTADKKVWEICLKLANAYWTRSQIEVLTSEPYRKWTSEMVLGHLRPNYPAFPGALLDVEYLGFWELAGCLHHWSATASEDDVQVIKRPTSEEIVLSRRYGDEVLRSSMSQRLQGTVLEK